MQGKGMQGFSKSSYYRKRNRKIRVIYYDPEATDSSSDDEDNNKACSHKKRLVREITIEVEADKLAEKKRVSDGPGRRLPNSKYKGLRQRKGGKWAAEIRHPLKCVQVWLGTYNTEEEAARAYQLKQVEFEALTNSNAASNYSNPGVWPGDAESLVMSHSCPESLMGMDSSGGKDGDVAKDAMSVEEKFEVGEDGLDIQMELDSLFINGYGQVFEDLSLFDDLPDFDFDLGIEDRAWIEEPFNVACCP